MPEPAVESSQIRKRDNDEIDDPTEDDNVLELDVNVNLRKKAKSMHEKLDEILDIVHGMADLKLAPTQPVNVGLSAPVSNKPEQVEDNNKDIDALKTLTQCKNVDRLCKLAQLSRYPSDNDEDGQFFCEICHGNTPVMGPSPMIGGAFAYDLSLGRDFTKNSQPQAFRNFKKNVAKLQTSQTHLKLVEKLDKDKDELRKREKKDQVVGITLGKQAYRVLKMCQPFGDYEIDCSFLAAAGVKVGNLNHSRKFVASMRPAFAGAIDARVKNYLHSPLDATLNLPPIGFVADKMTTRRWTGHLYGAIVFRRKNLLTAVPFGIKHRTRTYRY